MWRTLIGPILGFVLTAGLLVGTASGQSEVTVRVAPDAPVAVVQDLVVGLSVSASSDEASITFRLVNGESVLIRLRNGFVWINDEGNSERQARYERGGALDAAWRELVSDIASLSAADGLAAARGWSPGGLGEDDAEAVAAIASTIGALSSAPVTVVAPAAPLVAVGDIGAVEAARASLEAARAGLEAAGLSESDARDAAAAIADAREEIRDAIRFSVQDVRDGIRADIQRGDRGNFETSFASPMESLWYSVLGLFGAFLALTGVAFGASFFAEKQLDVVADTVSTSFFRSFFVGLFAQPLIIPAFGAMLVGLALTVVGILVIPVAILAFAATLVAATIGGYLAVARVAGSGWLRRKGQDYGTEGAAMLKSIAYGLGIVLLPWVPAVLFSGVPVAGSILGWTALGLTWALATAGFGAAILTRAGTRGTFGRKFAPAPVTPDELFTTAESRMSSTAEWMAGRTS